MSIESVITKASIAPDGPGLTSTAPSSSGLPELPKIESPTIIKSIFSHPSICSFPAGQPDPSYDPLEFVGDAYIELIATRLLHICYPNLTVRTKSAIREQLVCNDSLSRLAIKYGFDGRMSYIRESNKTISDKTWVKILADVFEAYVAGVMEDDPERGFGRIEAWLHPIFIDQIEANPVGVASNKTESNVSTGGDKFNLPTVKNEPVNPVEEGSGPLSGPGVPPQPPTYHCQEGIEARKVLKGLNIYLDESDRSVEIACAKSTLNTRLIYPPAGVTVDYRELEPPVERRATNDRIFTVGVYLNGWGYTDKLIGRGKGTSKARAGNEAAFDALTRNSELVSKAAIARQEFDIKRKYGGGF